MLETLKYFITDVENFKSENFIEPSLEAAEHHCIVGTMPDYVKAMYSICRRIEKDRDTLGVEMKHAMTSRRKELDKRFSETNQTYNTFSHILMFEIRSVFELWDKQFIVLLTGYRVAYTDEPDLHGLMAQTLSPLGIIIR